jgi:subtilisin family serine protease
VVFLLALCACGSAAAATADNTTDPLVPKEWWLAEVGATSATPPGPGIPLTIVDSGVDQTHPEFAGRPNTTYLNDQTVNGATEYHGTVVASVAAAPENGVGIVGVYPQAALDIFDASPDPRGISDLSAVTGIRSAPCPGVINLSFGSTNPDSDVQAAVLAAVHNGCLVVAAAGNAGEIGNPATFPASWPHVFTVGASDENHQIASFSTASASVDVAAPGVDITGDIRDGLPLPSESLACVVAIHALQDLPYLDVVPALRELRRVLRPGGVLRVAVPDLERAIRAYLRGDRAYFYVPDTDAVTVGGKLVAQLIWYGSVRTPFTYDALEELLERAGFQDVRRCAFHQTVHGDPEIVTLDNRERESLFVEALR